MNGGSQSTAQALGQYPLGLAPFYEDVAVIQAMRQACPEGLARDNAIVALTMLITKKAMVQVEALDRLLLSEQLRKAGHEPGAMNVN